MNAFLDSCSGQGWQLRENAWDADAVVIWSVLWNGRMAANQKVYDHYKNLSRPVIVIDVGALRRGQTWKIALDNVNARGYYGHTTDLDWDRPGHLGIYLRPTSLSVDRVLIAAQHKKSLQMASLPSMEFWINQQITRIRDTCDLPIYIRPHPRSGLDLALLPRGVLIESPAKVAGTYDDYDLCFDACAVLNYNSGPGIQAGIIGAPVIVDPTSLAYPISIQPDEIGKKIYKDRERWFVEICHTEYTVEEIRKGLWLKRIRAGMN
jgi:hypothetical protein